MALTIGGKGLKPGGSGPQQPLTALEQKLTDRIATALRILASEIDAGAYISAIKNLDPDLFEKLLFDMNINSIDLLLRDTMRGIVLQGGTDEARRILRSNPRSGFSMQSALEYSGQKLQSGIILPTGVLPQVPDLEFAIETPAGRMFTTISQRATDYAQMRSAQLIREVTDANRLAIRRLVGQAFTRPNTVDVLGRQLRQIIGLHSRWANAVLNFDEKNFTAMVKAGVSPDTARARTDVLTKRYRDKLIRRRAEMIARTEVQQAQNYGRQASWEASDRAGLVDAASMKEWQTAPLASSYGGPCDICAALRGSRVPWNGVFNNGDVMPPAHPHCRCTAVLVPPTRGLQGLPSQDLGSWIAELDALEAQDAGLVS